MTDPPTILVASTKSVLLSLVLTFFFGPLGMLYSTVWGSIVMMLLSIPAFILTLGHAAFLVWPMSMVWGAWAVHRYNQRLFRRVGI